MLFQVIATFEDGNQDIFDIEIVIHDENKFLYEILDAIDYDVKNLIKLSICHIAKNKYEKLNWLYDRNGKYYFNYEINNDDDTKKWNELKVNYLKNIVTL